MQDPKRSFAILAVLCALTLAAPPGASAQAMGETHTMEGHAEMELPPFQGETARVEAAPERTVEVIAQGFEFVPKKIHLKANQVTEIKLVNQGPIDHVFVVIDDESDSDLIFLHAGPGETVSGTYRIARTGAYQIVCNLPRHAEAGMVGKLVVSEAGPQPADTRAITQEPGNGAKQSAKESADPESQ